MATERPPAGEPDVSPDALEEQQHAQDDQVLKREGLETELMEHDESEAGEDIHHAG
jgi:hypothetical protein